MIPWSVEVRFVVMIKVLNPVMMCFRRISNYAKCYGRWKMKKNIVFNKLQLSSNHPWLICEWFIHSYNFYNRKHTYLCPIILKYFLWKSLLYGNVSIPFHPSMLITNRRFFLFTPCTWYKLSFIKFNSYKCDAVAPICSFIHYKINRYCLVSKHIPSIYQL